MYVEYEGKHGREIKEFSESLQTCEKGTEKVFCSDIIPKEGSVNLYAEFSVSGERVVFANDRMVEDGKYCLGEIR